MIRNKSVYIPQNAEDIKIYPLNLNSLSTCMLDMAPTSLVVNVAPLIGKFIKNFHPSCKRRKFTTNRYITLCV